MAIRTDAHPVDESTDDLPCQHSGCPRVAEPRRKWCRAHRAQRERGALKSGKPRDYGRAPRERLRDAAINLRDAKAEFDELFRRSDDLLAKYAVEYAKALGYVKPAEKVAAPAES